MEIIKATYGGADVTSVIKARIKNGQLRMKVSNDTLGDPAPGTFKFLEVIHSEGIKKVPEGSYITLPESQINKLGIWYSNNNHDKTVRESVMNLQRFENVVDILTCVWNPIPGNPFYEVSAMTKSSSHLNIVIQILQLLYAARSSGKYKYVSFLEHDVLYPDGYFDFPDFETGIMTNMNYIGICEAGFQRKTANHEPLHQMTMIFTEAIAHFENLVKEAIEKGGVLVEPNPGRKQWMCPNPAIHVNHGRHFTSHFSIYSRDTYEEDAFWGKADSLINKLF
jgi:hypothetical protein